MIVGHKPNGYFVTHDPQTTRRVEGETRQCIHCQAMWPYVPGSGDRRGWCLRCMGFLCLQPACLAEQAQRKRDFPGYDCMPFDDWNRRLLERYHRDPRFTVLSSGIVVERDFEAPLRPCAIERVPMVIVP